MIKCTDNEKQFFRFLKENDIYTFKRLSVMSNWDFATKVPIENWVWEWTSLNKIPCERKKLDIIWNCYYVDLKNTQRENIILGQCKKLQISNNTIKDIIKRTIKLNELTQCLSNT